MSSEVAARLALLSLPGIGPARLSWLLTGGSAPGAVEHLRRGTLPPTQGPAPAGVTSKLIGQWTRGVRRADPGELLDHNEELGDRVVGPDHELWPFHDDPEPPALLFARGRLPLLSRSPLVALIGTRRCSTIGRRVAVDLGRGLAEAGIGVVSGLASGIDGAAHQGVLSAGGSPVAVVGTGLDVVYPTANRSLWSKVGETGLIVTEAPRGTRPERWRFPARNRLIAGLASVVVVVESHASGGSLHTVSAAIDRGKPVMAVPGAITSKASVGSNGLLVDGCAPVTSVSDILDTLGPSVGTARPRSAGLDEVDWPEGSCLARALLSQVTAAAHHLDDLIATQRATIPEVLAAVQELVAADLVVLDGSNVSLRQQPPL